MLIKIKEFLNKKRVICPFCKTGADSYKLNPNSECCPYITAVEIPSKITKKYYCPYFKELPKQ